MTESEADLAELASAAFSDCKDVSVKLSVSSDCGRRLLASRDLSGGQRALLAPRTHTVSPPGDGPEEAYLRQDFAIVCEICDSLGPEIFMTARVYWAALMSLTAEEGPKHRDWTLLSNEAQASLFNMFCPSSVSSLLPGRMLDSEATDSVLSKDGGTRLPQRQAKSVATKDWVVLQLCSRFDLGVEETKLEKLALLWKFNSFDCSSRRGVQVFLAAALLNHSCAPTCSWSLENEAFDLRTKACLAAGEEATISYLSEAELQDSTAQRRDRLASSWGFFCQCQHCSSSLSSCKQCDKEMCTIISDMEEPVYPGLRVFCDECGKNDLQGAFGYFLHCWTCDGDLCPSCASFETAAQSQ